MDDALWREERLLIDGKLVEAAGGETYENVNPATEQVIGIAADGSASDMDAAIGAARRVFDTTDWSTDVAFRVRCLRQLSEALLASTERFRPTIVAEVGCPVAITYGPQLDAALANVAWIADLVEGYEWETDLGNAEPFGIRSHRYIRREATGVVGAITPWNFPMQVNLAKAVPALAAGNTVVLKPAPDTPYTALLLGRLVSEQTDIPPGVLNIVTSSHHEVGVQLSADPRVDMVSFTGSTANGRKVMIAGAETIKKVFLELGGKSAAIALDDADIARAAAGAAMQITMHAGQGCAVTSRLLLPRSRYDEGVEAAVATARSIAYGDPTDPANFMGPLVSSLQRTRVLGYIDKAREEGGKVVLGGGIPEHLPTGWFVEPTVVADVDPDATIAQQEIFGPVLTVIPYDDEDHAVAIANNSSYGLSGAVSSGDLERARAVANRIRTGTMSLNGGIYYGADVPFGGYRQSGVGRESGRAGFEEYLETKSIAEPAR